MGRIVKQKTNVDDASKKDYQTIEIQIPYINSLNEIDYFLYRLRVNKELKLWSERRSSPVKTDNIFEDYTHLFSAEAYHSFNRHRLRTKQAHPDTLSNEPALNNLIKMSKIKQKSDKKVTALAFLLKDKLCIIPASSKALDSIKKELGYRIDDYYIELPASSFIRAHVIYFQLSSAETHKLNRSDVLDIPRDAIIYYTLSKPIWVKKEIRSVYETRSNKPVDRVSTTVSTTDAFIPETLKEPVLNEVASLDLYQELVIEESVEETFVTSSTPDTPPPTSVLEDLFMDSDEPFYTSRGLFFNKSKELDDATLDKWCSFLSK